MKKQWLLLLVFPILIILCDITFVLTEPEQHNYNPIGLGSFKVIKSSTIDPKTILSSIDRGDQNVFNFELGLPPDDWQLITSVEWRQEDFINLANSIYHATWNESGDEWKLAKMGYYTECDHPQGFSTAEFYFYLETSEERKYYARDISMEPEYGYVSWGGEAYFYRPLFSWIPMKIIDLKKITVTAEEALRRAEASGGMDVRQSWEECHVSVSMWPDAYERYDWHVRYWDNNSYTVNNDAEFWIPVK